VIISSSELAVVSPVVPQRDLSDFCPYPFEVLPASVQGSLAEANSRSLSDRFPAPSAA
jgi:hypothetical protein